MALVADAVEGRLLDGESPCRIDFPQGCLEGGGEAGIGLRQVFLHRLDDAALVLLGIAGGHPVPQHRGEVEGLHPAGQERAKAPGQRPHIFGVNGGGDGVQVQRYPAVEGDVEGLVGIAHNVWPHLVPEAQRRRQPALLGCTEAAQHRPGWEAVVHRLGEEGQAPARACMDDGLVPTGDVAQAIPGDLLEAPATTDGEHGQGVEEPHAEAADDDVLTRPDA